MQALYRVILYGLGPIGQRIARLVLERPRLQIVAAIDNDPALANQSLVQVLGVSIPQDVSIAANANAVLGHVPADVIVHCTGSRLSRVHLQLEAIVNAGYNVVSTCEELAYPAHHHPKEAQSLHAAAQERGVSVLGTGVNPGFVMDALPAYVTSLCARVDHVKVLRRVNAAQRRKPLQLKIGAGLTPEAFHERVHEGALGHVGLVESVVGIAAALGWNLTDISDTIEPIIASEPLATEHVRVEPGQASGLHQIARGLDSDRERVLLDLWMGLDVGESEDVIDITGEPNLRVRTDGVHGDISTAAIVVNALPKVVAAAPGLLTMHDPGAIPPRP